ncbi:MAG: UDP-N-acetylmuramoyl-L-alanine--D-glutamate ligase [Gammaproteobacteria bacterium]|nr:MAG: UDP-N-acetylmuramoyl-L-alanine--D-glutamate ligase [Gammaproteobacteria bacterium]
MRDVQAERVLVVGLGRTGLSCVRYLHGQGVDVAVTDSRETPPELPTLQRELPEVPVFLGGFDPAAFAGADRIVVSPGVPLSHPLIAEARARGTEVVGDIELFARAARAPIVAITGSNGKSTVTTLVYEMAREAGLEARAGGNLGTPALELLDGREPDLYVLELSSFQLEAVETLQARVAAILNLSADHLDRYSGMPQYRAAKARIFRHAEVQVANRDDPAVMALVDPNRPLLGFTLGRPRPGDYGLLHRDGRPWLARGDEPLLCADQLRLAGRHNLANALAALALAAVAGIPDAPALRTLRRFAGLPHRCQWVARIRGVDWYDDSKGTNVGATVAALGGFDRPVVLIAGGRDKGADFTELREAVCAGARALVLIGEARGKLAAAVGRCVPVVFADSMEAAVARAAELARPGDAVLLSPACASFDMFRDYRERGDRFIEAVRRLEE